VATSPVTVDVMSRQEFWCLLNEAPELSDRLYRAMTERLTEHTS
jgi:CRP-like cAMP-binding protein